MDRRLGNMPSAAMVALCGTNWSLTDHCWCWCQNSGIAAALLRGVYQHVPRVVRSCKTKIRNGYRKGSSVACFCNISFFERKATKFSLQTKRLRCHHARSVEFAEGTDCTCHYSKLPSGGKDVLATLCVKLSQKEVRQHAPTNHTATYNIDRLILYHLYLSLYHKVIISS